MIYNSSGGLGGIIVKEVLRRSKGATFQPQNQSLYTSTCGVIFLATPHRGSPWATWAKLAANVSKVVLRSPNTAVLDSLNVGNQLLDMIAEEFSIMLRMNDIKAYSFHEERPMSGVLGLNEKVVPDFSAIIGDPSEGREGIDANHIQICKYTGKDDSGYIRVLGAIRLYVDVLNERQSRSEEEQITQDLETLPTAVGQKIRTNRALNHLQLGSTSGHIIIRIPRFPENVLGLSTDYVSPSNRIFGSGAFKLAATLKLLPGQANEGFAQIEDFGLHELVHDNYTYYSRISRRGLLKLLSGKVSRISQEGNSLIVKTGIGLFTFNSVDGQRLVRYDASDRSTDVAMFDVDFEDVQRCVSRRYRRLEPDNPEHEIWMGDHEERRTGSHYWTGPMEPSVAILFQDLDHPSCPRFMSIREPSELERQCQFNGDVLTAFTWVAQQKPALFADLAQSLQLIQILQTKRILQARSLEINNSSSRWMLGEIAASRGLHDNAGESKAFLHRCSLFHDELLEVYGESRSRIAVQNHMLATVEQAKPIVAGASCLAMIAKGNAEFLLTFAVPAPDPCEPDKKKKKTSTNEAKRRPLAVTPSPSHPGAISSCATVGADSTPSGELTASLLQPGEHRLSSSYVPGLRAGMYHVLVEQTITVDSNTKKVFDKQTQTFDMLARRFALSVWPTTALRRFSIAMKTSHDPTFEPDELHLTNEQLNGPNSLFPRLPDADKTKRTQSPTMAIDLDVAHLVQLDPNQTVTPVQQVNGAMETKTSVVAIPGALFNSLVTTDNAEGLPQPGQSSCCVSRYWFLAHVRHVRTEGMAHAGAEDEQTDPRRAPLSVQLDTHVSTPVPSVVEYRLRNTQSNAGESLQVMDRQLGLMDISYSNAWNLGRTLAMADATFTEALCRIRKVILQQGTDKTRIQVMRAMGSLACMSTTVDLSRENCWTRPNTAIPVQALDSTLVAAVYQDEMDRPAYQIANGYTEEAGEEEKKVMPAPYDEHYIPHSADWTIVLRFALDLLFLLPIDENWTHAFVDGAISLGNHGDRETDHVRDSMHKAIQRYC
ncbi:uncharacterized protein CDV56_103078 [Aspergillus thermomutatus]|uniref:Uncharacterized protein n=1 Tax=Aspergillus thermomutatus TaxID=41047 RepID=A0A397GFZ1_ASPTH|nr:uncharacterized protein CDV56_103078 [Aspergillus thermomutatus]RHZ47020.1 hypothetical protein CDV56_103078 [Aspergillus thermomutatus]